ncbi:46391_t:CDS:2 [Gigaspora margarita]|uniref:46391_t:CDS:1 n=1 Tax=Gigaspora margarita TaxID=4874 RepID=A0ABN7V3M8_GIGMA|nr:46391_t:CDS:2 [Gigaspora margarita]
MRQNRNSGQPFHQTDRGLDYTGEIKSEGGKYLVSKRSKVVDTFGSSETIPIFKRRIGLFYSGLKKGSKLCMLSLWSGVLSLDTQSEVRSYSNIDSSSLGFSTLVADVSWDPPKR